MKNLWLSKCCNSTPISIFERIKIDSKKTSRTVSSAIYIDSLKRLYTPQVIPNRIKLFPLKKTSSNLKPALWAYQLQLVHKASEFMLTAFCSIISFLDRPFLSHKSIPTTTIYFYIQQPIFSRAHWNQNPAKHHKPQQNTLPTSSSTQQIWPLAAALSPALFLPFPCTC